MSMTKCKVCNDKITYENVIDKDLCNKEVCLLVLDYVRFSKVYNHGEFKTYPQSNE